MHKLKKYEEIEENCFGENWSIRKLKAVISPDTQTHRCLYNIDSVRLSCSCFDCSKISYALVLTKWKHNEAHRYHRHHYFSSLYTNYMSAQQRSFSCYTITVNVSVCCAGANCADWIIIHYVTISLSLALTKKHDGFCFLFAAGVRFVVCASSKKNTNKFLRIPSVSLLLVAICYRLPSILLSLKKRSR